MSNLAPDAALAIAHSDPLWAEMFAFLARHGIALERIAAPQAVCDHCPSMINAADALNAAWSEIDAVVIHKGLISHWPADFLHQLLRRLMPGYANAVFVVYTRHAREIYNTDDVQAFLEKLPKPVSRLQRNRGIAVYRGNGQMICSDAGRRKLIVPVAAPWLLAAILNGDALVDTVRNLLPGANGRLFNLVDFGAGIGLLGIASKHRIGEDGIQAVIETDDGLIDVLAANTDLAGLFWRTEFLTSRPASLDAIKTGSKGERALFLWLERKPRLDLTAACSHFHLDIDFGLRGLENELSAYLAANLFPAVIVSQGLSGRRPSTNREQDWQQLAGLLIGRGYRLSRSYDGPMAFGLDVFEHHG